MCRTVSRPADQPSLPAETEAAAVTEPAGARLDPARLPPCQCLPGLGQDHTCCYSSGSHRQSRVQPSQDFLLPPPPTPPPTPRYQIFSRAASASCQSLSLMSLPCFVQLATLHLIIAFSPADRSFFLSSQQPSESMISTGVNN